MKKTAFLIVLFSLAASGLFAQAATLPRLAVVQFSVNTARQKAQEDAIAVRNLVQSNMVASGKYEVITRDEIDRLIENQQIQVSSISSAENIRKLQLQNISYIVTGTVDSMDNDYSVTISLLDVSNGRFSHSTSQFMSNTSADIYNKTATLVSNFQRGLSNEGETVVQNRPGASSSGIAIEVSTDISGTLYLQEEEIAQLWDNDTYTIPIERPGTYSLRLQLVSGMAKATSVSIITRGVTRVDFSTLTESYLIGSIGPAGGIIFHDKGSFSNGWRYLEAAPANTEFTATWNTARDRCSQLNVNGITGWFLPSIEYLKLMYDNLAQKGLGSFKTVEDRTNQFHIYFSSSDLNSRYYVYRMNFSNGVLDHGEYRGSTYSARAVRAF